MVAANSIFQKDGKTLTAYGFACGYVQNKGLKGMYREHNVYHVTANDPNTGIRTTWETFDTLHEARKFFSSIK